MTDKDNVSMATVQMKADYAASEVYSTASEPPPAYKRQANSVKIAKITAFTIIVSSFILGAFILASSYLQAKASCDQVQALDSVLEKELMLETLQQVNKELPRAEALLGKENSDENDLQNLEKEEPMKKVEYKPQAMSPQAPNEEENHENDNSYSETLDNDEMSKFPSKVPLELDLSELAAALLKNNKKSRMNCVVERKHAEEIVDSPSKTVALPFGVNLKTDPKKARITGERISIFCDGGDENKEQEPRNNREESDDESDDFIEPERPMFIPYQRIPIRFGRIPQEFPLTHMPQRMMPPVQLQQQPPHPQRMMPPLPMQQTLQQQQQQQMPPQQMQHQIPQQPMIRQLGPLSPFHQLPLRPPMPPQVMQAPQPEPARNPIFAESLQQQQPPQQPQQPPQQTVRIHFQQIPFREIQLQRERPVQAPSTQQQLPFFEIQLLPSHETAEDPAFSSISRTFQSLVNWMPRDDEDDDSSTSEEIINNNSNNNSNNNNEDNSNETEQSLSRTSSSEEQDKQQLSAEQQQHIVAVAQAFQQAQQKQQQEQAAQQTEQRQQQQQQEQQQQQSDETEQPRMQQPARLILQPLPEQPTSNLLSAMERVVFGRSLAQPVRIPVPMMQAQADASNDDSDRPHSMS